MACDRDVAALTVRDYGSGLEPGDEVRVFRRFWRADPSRARSTGGTGLGLAIAQEDAKLHGGGSTRGALPVAGRSSGWCCRCGREVCCTVRRCGCVPADAASADGRCAGAAPAAVLP